MGLNFGTANSMDIPFIPIQINIGRENTRDHRTILEESDDFEFCEGKIRSFNHGWWIFKSKEEEYIHLKENDEGDRYFFRCRSGRYGVSSSETIAIDDLNIEHEFEETEETEE